MSQITKLGKYKYKYECECGAVIVYETDDKSIIGHGKCPECQKKLKEKV